MSKKYEDMKVEELKRELRDKNLPTSGKKIQLIARLNMNSPRDNQTYESPKEQYTKVYNKFLKDLQEIKTIDPKKFFEHNIEIIEGLGVDVELVTEMNDPIIYKSFLRYLESLIKKKISMLEKYYSSSVYTLTDALTDMSLE